MIDVLIALGLFVFAIIGIVLLVYFANQPTKNTKEGLITEPSIGTFHIPKIKNGSRLTIGSDRFTNVVIVGQHFNWLQKRMWKFFLGIKVEDYSEEN